MAIHLFEDSALTQQISEGDLTNPDDDTYNGTDGESKDKELFLANEQSALASPLASGETSLQLAEPRFTDGEVIIVDAEQMRILSGGGTTTLGVERGYGGTTAAAHNAGAVVYSGTTTRDWYWSRWTQRVEMNPAGTRWQRPSRTWTRQFPVIRSTWATSPTTRPSPSGVAAPCPPERRFRTRRI